MAWGTGEDMLLVVGVKSLVSRELKNGEDEGHFCSPGGVPWQRKTLLREAKSPLQQNNPSIRQGIANRMEFLYDERSF